jgi:hypothetical protein
MDLPVYQDLILSQLSAFLILPAEDERRFRSAVVGAVADLAKGRRTMEQFRRTKPYDADDAGLVRRHRLAWETFLRDRGEVFARLGSALPDGPRGALLREQSGRWMSCLEDPPDAPSLPQDGSLVPIRKK